MPNPLTDAPEDTSTAGMAAQEQGYFKVTASHAIAVHETPSLASAAVCFKQPGQVVRGEVQGEFCKLTSGEGFALVCHPTEGPALAPLSPALFKVAHKTVLVRAHATTSAKVLKIKKEGDDLLVDGHLEGWLKVHGLPSSSPRDQQDGSQDPSAAALGWVLITHQAYGKLCQHMEGEVPTFADERALEGSMDTPRSVYTGKQADPLTERLKLELAQMRTEVGEREQKALSSTMADNYDVVRRGLMSNAGQAASGSFCVGGDPL